MILEVWNPFVRLAPAWGFHVTIELNFLLFAPELCRFIVFLLAVILTERILSGVGIPVPSWFSLAFTFFKRSGFVGFFCFLIFWWNHVDY